MTAPLEDLLTGALVSVVRRLTADAAAESLYGDFTFTPEDVARLWGFPVAFDPRFDLNPDAAPLVVDQVTQVVREAGGPPSLDLRQKVLELGLEEPLETAETIGDYLEVLKQAVKGGPAARSS